jgi:glutamate racemase
MNLTGYENTENKPSILVIDSGIGGLSVCESILANEQNLQIIYFADDAFFPYGLQDEAVLRQRLKYIVAEMLARHQPELIVLACNTVSTLVLPELRASFDVPFVGVVPAIKPAASMSKTKRIGLLATPATVKRAYTDQLVSDYADECDVIRVGSSELVVQAENLLQGRVVCRDTLSRVLKPFHCFNGQKPVDTIVLGCTHFPFLQHEFRRILPEVMWVDSGAAIAMRVFSLLADVDFSRVEAPVHQLYFSNKKPDYPVFSGALKRLGFLRHDVSCF